MVKKIGSSLFIFFSLISGSLLSVESSINIFLETTDEQSLKQACIGDPFFMKVQFLGANYASDFPAIPGAEKFDIVNYNTSSHTVSINGKVSHSIIYTYVVTPKELGPATFGPLIIDNNGKKTESNVVKFNVGTELLTHDQLQKKDYFLTTTLSKNKLYLGEKLIVTFTFYSFGSSPDLKVPKFDFNKFSCSGEIKNKRNGKELVNGREYSTLSFSLDLYPEEVGSLLIPRVQMAFMSQSTMNSIFNFMGMTSSNAVLSSAKAVMVVDLPDDKKFKDVSAVGEFDSMKFELKKNEASVGDGVTAIISISGNGNFEMIKFPKLNLPKGLKYYEASSTIKKINDNRQEKIFEFVLQAEKAGNFKISEQEFKFFDLKDRKYKKLKNGYAELKVTESSRFNTVKNDWGSSEDAAFEFQNWQISSIYSDFGSQKKVEPGFIEKILKLLSFLFGCLALLFFMVLLSLFIFPFKMAVYYSFLFRLYLIRCRKNINDLQGLFEEVGTYYKVSLHEGGVERLFNAAGKPKEFVDDWIDFWARFMSFTYSSRSTIEKKEIPLFKEAVSWAKKLLYFSDKIKVR